MQFFKKWKTRLTKRKNNSRCKSAFEIHAAVIGGELAGSESCVEYAKLIGHMPQKQGSNLCGGSDR
jgi:hypothetical protein